MRLMDNSPGISVIDTVVLPVVDNKVSLLFIRLFVSGVTSQIKLNFPVTLFCSFPTYFLCIFPVNLLYSPSIFNLDISHES